MWIDRPIRLSKFISVLCEPGWAWNNLTLNDLDLWLVWSGRGWATLDDERFELAPGTLICFRPGSTYCAGHDPQSRMGLCVVHFDVIDEAQNVVQLKPEEMPPHIGRIPDVDLFQRLLKHAATLYQSGEPRAREEVTMYVRGMLAAMQRSVHQPVLAGTAREHHDMVWSAVRHIRENPGESFSIEDVAERVNYSADHFSRLFKKIVGMAPKEFCIRTRLERAQTLLRESAMSVDQIAADLGYSDMFFFSRQFKQRMGMSPSLWRKAQAKD